MDKEEKKQVGVSLFGQSDYLVGEDPIEEMFALNLGDFIAENLISEDLAKKISTKANKKERLQNQLKELIDIYSSKNTLCVLNFSTNEEQAIYTSISKSIVQMLEVESCKIYLTKDKKLTLVGNSTTETSECNVKLDELMHQDIIQKENLTYIPMRSSVMPAGVIEIKSEKELDEDYLELIISIANLLGTTITLQGEVEHTNQLISDNSTSEIELKQQRAELTALIGDLCDYQQNFVESLANAVDRKGQYTVSHSRNTAKLARGICRKLGLNEKTTDLIYYAGLLQNIGKITLPEKIFATNGKLSSDELQKIKNHINVGVNLLMNINFLSEVVPYITYQSERVDGSGTPEGLKGQSIPLGSRIIAVADAYSAMTSDRPFRKAMDSAKALEIITSETDTKWDKDVVNALQSVIKG
ncbi:HD domain-containing protein [bacterium]|jgi:HD-GYP domain-containing protein (c-di-GMP phosphodiesterase class II)|nr:HD domain-containing protein [bacterium]MEE0496350.1 HD domain-containing phosphohydrolase [Cyanobacteriota bacterium]